MRLALLLVVACGSAEVPLPPPPLRPDPEPRATPLPPPREPDPSPEPRTLQSFPGLDLLESPSSAIHDHGGPAAQVAKLHLNFNVIDRRAHQIEARSIELLRRSCNEDKWRSRKKLDITGYAATWDDPTDPTVEGEAIGRTELVLPPGVPRRAVVAIRFKPVEVYQACDVFGFALDLVVDRVRHVFELPLEVTREEPMD